MQLLGHKGVNQMKEQPEYQRALNVDPKEMFEYLTPFHIYNGPQSNVLQTTDRTRGRNF